MRASRTVLAVILAGLAAVPSAAGVQLIGYEDPIRKEAVYHGVIREGHEDEWERGLCLPAFNTYHLNLSVPEQHGRLGETSVELRAPHLDAEDGWTNRSATAQPGDPAGITVYQGCYRSVTFTVEGLVTPAPTKYRVNCTGGCYDPLPYQS